MNGNLAPGFKGDQQKQLTLTESPICCKKSGNVKGYKVTGEEKLAALDCLGKTSLEEVRNGKKLPSGQSQ